MTAAEAMAITAGIFGGVTFILGLTGGIEGVPVLLKVAAGTLVLAVLCGIAAPWLAVPS